MKKEVVETGKTSPVWGKEGRRVLNPKEKFASKKKKGAAERQFPKKSTHGFVKKVRRVTGRKSTQGGSKKIFQRGNGFKI